MNNLEQQESNYRVIVALVALIIGLVFIGIMSLVFPAGETVPGEIALADVLFDRSTDFFPYPFTIQNIMWLLFSIGFGELWVRFDRGRKEMDQLKRGLLPEDDSTMLRAKELVPIFTTVVESKHTRYLFLPRLICRIVLQFQNSRSIDQSNNLMNSSLELMQHEIDLKYNMIRYVVWLIPTIGFIGTVIGIALALSAAADMPDLSQGDAIRLWMGVLTTKLGVAFNTTLLALILSATLVFFMHISQGREETALNSTGQYCMDNLINRLYEER